MLSIHVRAPVQPSEDPGKVEEAVANAFPETRLVRGEDAVEASLDSFDAFGKLLRRQKILDASRRSLLRSLAPDGRHARFRLHKQAAYSGRVSFSEGLESPLGDIVVDVEGDDLEGLFKALAPMTKRGIPVSEEEAERILAKRLAAKEKRDALRADARLAAGVAATNGDEAWPPDEDDEDADEEDPAA